MFFRSIHLTNCVILLDWELPNVDNGIFSIVGNLDVCDWPYSGDFDGKKLKKQRES